MFGYFRNACMISFYNKKERSGDTNWTISRRRHYLSNLFKYKTCKKLMKPSRQQNSVWYHNWLHHHDASSRVWRYPEFFLVPVLFSGTNFFWDRYQYHPKKGRILGKKVDILVHYITIVFQLWQNSRHREGPGCHTLASRQTLRCEAYSPLLPEKVLTDSLILVVLCKLHLFHFFHVLVVFFISICRYRS